MRFSVEVGIFQAAISSEKCTFIPICCCLCVSAHSFTVDDAWSYTVVAPILSARPPQVSPPNYPCFSEVSTHYSIPQNAPCLYPQCSVLYSSWSFAPAFATYQIPSDVLLSISPHSMRCCSVQSQDLGPWADVPWYKASCMLVQCTLNHCAFGKEWYMERGGLQGFRHERAKAERETRDSNWVARRGTYIVISTGWTEGKEL